MRDWEELYLAHRQAVYGYLLSLTRDPLLAEDLLSETFLQALRSVGNFRGESSVRTWLCGIARNLWLRQLRSKKELLGFDERIAYYVGETLEDSFADAQTVQRIKEFLAEKDERTAKVVKMRLELYSYSEIAEQLQISENSARVIEFRTRKWLKDILKKEGVLE